MFVFSFGEKRKGSRVASKLRMCSVLHAGWSQAGLPAKRPARGRHAALAKRARRTEERPWQGSLSPWARSRGAGRPKAFQDAVLAFALG